MKELPEITSGDEGKILQVNNGKPSWSSSGSSGGGVLVATVTWNEDSTAATLSATYNQLLSAQFCVARWENSEEHGYERTIIPLASLYEESGDYGAVFHNYFNGNMNFVANSPDGVMTYSQQD